MKRCILHIGPPKTGSTSLQHFLATNRETLAAHGIDYPAIGGGLHHGDLFRPLFVASTGETKGDLRTALPAFEQAIEAIVAAAGGDVLILSAEGLMRLSERDRLHEVFVSLFSRHGYSLESVAFIRPQFSYFNSKYAQGAKLFRIRERFSRYLEAQIREDGANYLGLFRPWYETPGLSLAPVPFTREEMPHGLAHRFFAACGLLDRLDGVLDWQTVSGLNVSPGPKTVEVLRRLAARRLKHRLKGNPVAIRTFILTETSERGWNATSFRGVDEALKARIVAHHAVSNAAFAERFWGASWDETFAEESARPATSNEYYPGNPESQDEAELRAFVALVERRFAGRLDRGVVARLRGRAATVQDHLARRRAIGKGS